MAKKNRMPVESVGSGVNAVATRKSADADAAYEARERKYRAEEALSTIERAEAHKRDKSLMKDVKACAREKKKTYDKL